MEAFVMTEFWKQCEGQIVNGEFRLLRVLESGDNGAIFLAEKSGEKDSKFAVKLLREASIDADLQLARWKMVAEITHPLLLKVFSFGRCQISEQAMLFVVMEYAEESLSEILPQRALSSTEVSEMAGPIIEALVFLHGKGLVHGHLKPANILAAGDHLKLSSDGICRAGDQLFGSKQSLYVAPEAVNGTAAASNDVWALGVTLTEALTQSLPVWKSSGHEDPRLPKPLPPPFDVIVPRCLSYDPQRRWKLSEVAKRLSGNANSEPSKDSAEKDVALEKPAPTKSFAAVRYATISVLVVLAVALIGYGVVHHGETSSVTNISQAHPADLEENGPQAMQPAPSPAPVAVPVENKVVSAGGEQDIVQKILPTVPASARRTIHGRVHVGVKVKVDASGNVQQASLDPAGPSQYFARLALEASRNWKFVPADAPSENSSRQWQLHYLFGRKDTTVSIKQLH